MLTWLYYLIEIPMRLETTTAAYVRVVGGIMSTVRVRVVILPRRHGLTFSDAADLVDWRWPSPRQIPPDRLRQCCVRIWVSKTTTCTLYLVLDKSSDEEFAWTRPFLFSRCCTCTQYFKAGCMKESSLWTFYALCFIIPYFSLWDQKKYSTVCFSSNVLFI